jgi:hypothetical protein
VTSAAQKAAELRHVKQFLSLERLDATIEHHGDAPDFVLRFGGRRIGLEHTELADEMLSKAAARVKSFEEALRCELERAVPADIGVTVFASDGALRFEPLGRREVAILAQKIGALATRAHAGLRPGTSVDVDAADVALLRGGLQAIEVRRYEHARGPLCHVQNAYWGGGDSEVRSAIRAKERLLPQYRADATLAEVWLLLVTGDKATQTVDLLLVRDEPFRSDYDRVYLLDARVGKSRRIHDRISPV